MKKYCFYYKGEKENPYEPGTDIHQWWWYESMYFKHVFPADRSRWEKLAVSAANDIPAIEFLMIAGDVPIETKGFLAWSVATTLPHAALETFDFFREYGRGFLPEHLYTGEIPDRPMTEEERFKLCRYYKGGEQNPFEASDMRYTFWEIEKTWFKLVANDFSRQGKYLVPFLLSFEGGLRDIPVDDTLKATLYEHYIRFGGSKSGFVSFLLKYMKLAS